MDPNRLTAIPIFSELVAGGGQAAGGVRDRDQRAPRARS